tara:strand:- start:10645 stop:10905 length:261 start_codon:yes stop_codon:yes gene_type:complete
MSNHRETRYSKGDFRRPENRDKFSANFDAIFGKVKVPKSVQSGAREAPKSVQRKSYETNETLRVQNQTTEEWLAEYEEELSANSSS